MRRDLHEFLIVILRFLEITRLNCNLCQPVNDHSSNRRSVICSEKNLPAVIVPSDLLINLPCLHQGIDVLYLAPVNGIDDFNSLLILSLRCQGLHLIHFQFVFIFIQLCHLKRANFPLLLSYCYYP